MVPIQETQLVERCLEFKRCWPAVAQEYPMLPMDVQDVRGRTTERFCGLLCKNLVVLNEHLLVKLGQSAAVILPIPDGTLIELCQRNIDVGRKWKRQYEKGLLELYESVR